MIGVKGCDVRGNPTQRMRKGLPPSGADLFLDSD